MRVCQTHLFMFRVISWLVAPTVRQIARGLVARGSCASGPSSLGQDCHKSRPAGRLEAAEITNRCCDHAKSLGL